jgi:serine/threonine protein kinase
VLRMLAKTPKKRASAAELLKHPWMKKQYTDHHVSENSQRQIFGGLKKFNVK